MASSRMLALLGLLAVAGYQNRDKLGQLLGQVTGGGPRLPGEAPNASSGLNDFFGSLGGLLGGRTVATGEGGGIGGALGDLVDAFTQRGSGQRARSWVESGRNEQVGPSELEQVLGEDTIQQLMQRTELSRTELLNRLSDVLPVAVDGFTPEGRLPTPAEERRWQTAI